MTSYSVYAESLHQLANRLELLDVAPEVAPEPEHPDQVFFIHVALGSRRDLQHMALIVDTEPVEVTPGIATVSVRVGHVELCWMWIEPAAQAEYQARAALVAAMAVCAHCGGPATTPVRDGEAATWLGAGAATFCSRACKDAADEHAIEASAS